MPNLFGEGVSRRWLLTEAGLEIVSVSAIGGLAKSPTAQPSTQSAQSAPRGGELPRAAGTDVTRGPAPRQLK